MTLCATLEAGYVLYFFFVYTTRVLFPESGPGFLVTTRSTHQVPTSIVTEKTFAQSTGHIVYSYWAFVLG